MLMKEVFEKWYSRFYNKWYFRKYRFKSITEVFEHIYHQNVWRSRVSSSGPGSDLNQTTVIRDEFQKVISDFRIKSILDIPCGDWHWMQHVDLSGVRYVGGDIVADIIKQNQELYDKEDVIFEVLNILSDEFPAFDLIICRDCLVHFSYADIHKALCNLMQSKCSYLLTTTFPKRKNYDIVTGNWRPVNLERTPFNLSKPIRIINERCTESNCVYKDKSLGLWDLRRVKSIGECIAVEE